MEITPEIIYEDAHLLVINKPAGLAVHEGHGTHYTLTDWLAARYPDSPLKEQRYGLVHRLDKDTSGVLLIAKDLNWFTYLQGLFKEHRIKKTYQAVVQGHLPNTEGMIDIPIARSQVYRTRFEANATGRPSRTVFKVLKPLLRYSHLELYPETGRTHQLRVHLSSIGHAIVGDRAYGGTGSTRALLHAARIAFESPTGQPLSFEVPLPADFQTFLNEAK